MRILGLDVGEKRIGVARVDSSTRIAVPIGFINVDGGEWEQLAHLASLNNTKFFVLGLPRSNEGNETAQSLYARNFAKTLIEKIPDAKVRFQDESLTSVEAEKRLKARKKKFEKGEIDAEAASIILQDFIENFHDNPAQNAPKPTNIVTKNTQKAMLNSKKIAKKSKKLIALIVTPIGLAILGFIALGCFLWYSGSLNPICSTNCEDVAFAVNEGDSNSTIATNLEDAGLIRSAFFFKLYLKLNHADAQLKSGNYTLNTGLSTSEITEALIAGGENSNVFRFTILPGETIMDVKSKLLDLGYAAADIDKALYASYDFPVLKDKPSDASLEGYLFGDTHEFYKNASVRDIFSAFIGGLDTVVTENNLKAQFAARGLNLHEGIILASIVQREAFAADQPTVAQVFLKRLSIGMGLGSDVTVTYALDLIDPDRQNYDNNYDAIAVDSCYNTRKYAGLPCGAISNPSLSALLAVANPSDTDYLYFLTGDDEKMYYSYTEYEHNQAARDHCQKLCAISLWKIKSTLI